MKNFIRAIVIFVAIYGLLYFCANQLTQAFVGLVIGFAITYSIKKFVLSRG